ncbi:MAG: DJ-1/PfpI family protein [Ruminococcaceae bacterium]|nr:DJ-1/PfpI family protein [Oscillospiraceae bacterium]
MVYLFLAEGFEEVEALTPTDYLRRAGIEVCTVGIGGEYITGAHGITVKADIAERELCARDEDIEMVILPGGMPGTLNLKNSRTVNSFIDRAAAKGAYIAAICAAPSILGEKGLLSGKTAICYPGFEEKLFGACISENDVAVSQNIITAKAAGSAALFSAALIDALCNKGAGDAVLRAVFAK